MVKDISDKHIFIFGAGAVGCCLLFYLDQWFKITPNKLGIFDILEEPRERPEVKNWLEKGAQYFKCDLNKNYDKIISKMKPYDIVIDVTCTTDSLKFLEACKKQNVHYINTSIECIESVSDLKKDKDRFKNTYQASHNEAHRIDLLYPNNKATIIQEMGMNPGLISALFTKSGLLHLAKNSKQTKELKMAVKNGEYNTIARILEIEVIHCSETDSADKPVIDTFNNTWCVPGLLFEYEANSEICYGSHEKQLPNKKAELLYDNILDLNEPCKDVYIESYVPGEGKIIGCVITHGENISLANWLSDNKNDVLYSPTINYAYKLPICAWRSIQKLKKKLLDPNLKTHVMNNLDDKFDGVDKIGSLMITKDKKAVWCGSILDNSQNPYNGGTTQQVMAGIFSGLMYCLHEPNKGCIFPEETDLKIISKYAIPYLGEFFCNFVPYKPKSSQFVDLRRTKKEFDSQYRKEI